MVARPGGSASIADLRQRLVAADKGQSVPTLGALYRRDYEALCARARDDAEPTGHRDGVNALALGVHTLLPLPIRASSPH